MGPVLLMALLLGSAGVEGKGPLRVAERKVAAFSRLDVQGAVKVHVRIGQQTSVQVRAEDNIQDAIVTRVEDGTLHISLPVDVVSPRGAMVDVVMPRLDALRGAGRSTIDVVIDKGARLQISLTGGSRIGVGGRVNALVVDARNAARLDAGSLTCASGEVLAEGAAQVQVGPCDALTVDARGVATVRYRGKPALRTKKTMGARVLAE